MSDLRLRPRFKVRTELSSADALRRLEESLGAPDVGIVGRVYEGSAVLKVPPGEVHFWSPQLQVSVEDADDGTAVIHGLFGPHPTIWSSFVAAYTAAIFIGVMGLLFAASQWSIGQHAWSLWAVPAAAVLAAIVFVAARIGRRLGAEQTARIRTFIESAVSAIR